MNTPEIITLAQTTTALSGEMPPLMFLLLALVLWPAAIYRTWFRKNSDR